MPGAAGTHGHRLQRQQITVDDSDVSRLVPGLKRRPADRRQAQVKPRRSRRSELAIAVLGRRNHQSLSAGRISRSGNSAGSAISVSLLFRENGDADDRHDGRPEVHRTTQIRLGPLLGHRAPLSVLVSITLWVRNLGQPLPGTSRRS